MSEPDSSQPDGPAITSDDPSAAAISPLGRRGQADDADPDCPGQPPEAQPPEGQPEDWQDSPPGEPDEDEDDGYVPV